jgi:hypothetical protein
MDQLQRVLRAVDGYQQRHAWLGFPVAVVKKYGDDHAGGHAALLAYYGFFSLFPLLLALVTVLGFALQGRDGLRQDILDSALASSPSSATTSGRASARCVAAGWPWRWGSPGRSGAASGWRRRPRTP